MQVGKLTNAELKRLIFDKLKTKREEVIVGASIGSDCAVADIKDNLMVISTDPITGTDKGIGKLCVNVCSNDIAAFGAEPVAILITLLIPPYVNLAEVEQVIDDAIGECQKYNIALIGGHTEVSSAVNRFVLSGVCIGKKNKRELKKVDESFSIVMSKSAGLEGTSIIAYEKEDELKEVLTDEELSRAKGFMDNISVLNEGRIGASCDVPLMHDVTEGGVFGAVWEMANNAGLGVELYKDKIKIDSVTKKICTHYEIDPLKLISSGVMIFATDEPIRLIDALKEENINAYEIAHFTLGDCLVVEEDQSSPLEPPQSDELYRVV